MHRCHVSPRCRGGRAKWGRTPQTSKPLNVACAAVAESCTGHIVHHQCALCAQALAVLVKGQRIFCFLFFNFFVFKQRCVFAPTSLSPKSGGTLSVAQRDSAVSDYKPCAEEPPAQSASQWGKNSTQGLRRDERAQRNLFRQRSFTELGFLTNNTAEVRIYHPQLVFILFYCCASPHHSSHRDKTRSFVPY